MVLMLLILRLALLIIAVTIDGFAAALTMGGSGISVPARSSAVLSLVGTSILAVSLFLSDILAAFIPFLYLKFVSTAVLVALGIWCIAKSRPKKDIEVDSDKNHDKIISMKEAFMLSAVLSADSLATGAASHHITEGVIPQTLIATFIVGFLFILLGNRLGKLCRKLLKFDFEKLCGYILILLAAVNLL
jgi:putative Mn2+ efflux pump MntP